MTNPLSAKPQALMLFSSSKGNCAYVKCGSDEILIDAGVSARRICASLKDIGTSIHNIRAIFVTHEHSDHINGLRTLSKCYKLPVYAPLLSARHMACCIPETRGLLINNDGGDTVSFDYMSVTAFDTPHDSAASVGFRIDMGSESLGYATDIGHMSCEVLNGLTGCTRIVIESNHDVDMLKNGDYPYYLKKRILGNRGHLSNSDCARTLPRFIERGTSTVVLAHLSENNNRPRIAYSECAGSLAYSGINAARDGGGDVELFVAEPDRPVKII